MDGGEIVQYLDQPVVKLLRIVHRDELGGRVELVQQRVGIRARRQPLHPAALPVGPLSFSLQLLGFARVRRARENGKAAKPATLAILQVAFVDHAAQFR